MVDVFKLDDLVISTEKLQKSKVFQTAVIKKDYEVIIPKDEKDILIRDLKSSPYKKMADNLVNFYVEIDPSIDYLAQNIYLNKYLQDHQFILPWLVPIVRDEKLIYKKKLIGPATLPQDSSNLAEVQADILDYNNAAFSQVMVESLHNYHSVEQRINMVNHAGAYVLRLNINANDLLTDQSSGVTLSQLQFRGSYGDWQLVKVVEKAKTARKSVVTGLERVDRVVGEPLQVVGFALLPRNYPNPSFVGLLNNRLRDLTDISIDLGSLRGESKNNSLENILQEYLPNIGRILDQNQTPKIDLNGITDLRVLFKIFSWFGHDIQSLTQTNRLQIAQLIQTNINQIEKVSYTRADRLEYPEMEQKLIEGGLAKEGGILGPEVFDHPAMIKYRISFDHYPHVFHKYLQIIGRLDNGNIWLTLINPKSTAEDLERQVHHYQIIVQNREIARDLEISYENIRRKTMDNPDLFAHLIDPNPLSNILELRPEKRDQIAWYQYFKRGYPDRSGKNYLYHGKYIGCQHEYDRLYQMFEDSNDPFPLGKRYTRIIPNDGVVCSFCGDTLEDQEQLIDQGYDVRGQKINTYDNDGLIRETSNIDQFFKKTKSEVVRSGEKLVEQWIELSEKSMRRAQAKAFKYKILKNYEEVINENKFFFGLQQNPNKLVKSSQDQQFGQFLLRKYNITDAKNPINYIFISKLFRFFYSISAVYDLVIQRLAVYFVVLNWQLVMTDPSYLNPDLLFSFYTPEQIGRAFLNYNLVDKNMFLNLKPGSKSDPFYDDFVEKAGNRIPQGDMTNNEYKNMLKGEYQKRRSRFLYTFNQVGEIFNGNNPFEHEVIRIFSEYMASKGNRETMVEIKESFNEYWKQWLDEHAIEAKALEENARIALIPQKGVLSERTPKERPLFDRYLAQHKFILNRKLEQVYLGLINENIYTIQGGPKIEGQEQVMFKKMYLLNKLNCDDWTNMKELEMIGMEEETARIKTIQQYKEEIAIIDNRMAVGGRLFFWPITGGFIVRDYQPREYQYFRYVYQPPDLVKRWNAKKSPKKSPKLKLKKKGKFDFILVRDPKLENRVIPRIGSDDLIGTAQMIRKDLGFLGKVEKLIKMMGSITYLNDLKKFSRHVSQIMNGQMNGVEGCNELNRQSKTTENKKYTKSYPNPTEFEEMYPQSIEGDYVQTKTEMLNLRKYIISHIRHHIVLMARIRTRQQMVQYGFEKYMELYDNANFNQAFEGFNQEKDDDLGRVFTNDEIDNMVVGNLSNYTKHNEVISNLRKIMIADLVRHLRQVRVRAGRFVKGQSSRQKKTDELDAGEIFIRFIQILFQEFYEDTLVIDVDFNHKDINQNFQAKAIWHKMDTAEKKGELEYKIARYALNLAEAEATANARGIDATTGTQEGTEEVFEALDMENDEDDYNDHDLSGI